MTRIALVGPPAIRYGNLDGASDELYLGPLFQKRVTELDMTRSKLLLGVLGTALLSACGPTQVVVNAELGSDDPEQAVAARALGDLEIRMLPFNRDVIFDSLTAAATTPEPPIPDSVLNAQNAVSAAQKEWRDTEARWNVLRDTLQTLSETLDGMRRNSGQYRLLYRDFQGLEAQYNRVERARDRAFGNFTSLQEASLVAAEETKLLREQWADEAFADVGVIMAARLQGSGGDILYDTTDASGVADGFEVKQGEWWISARYELPYTELYWNVPVTVSGRDPVQVRLTRENATVRPKL